MSETDEPTLTEEPAPDAPEAAEPAAAEPAPPAGPPPIEGPAADASPAVIDIEALLAPIPGDNPAGPDPRDDVTPTSPYYGLKDARNAARADERQAAMSDDPASAPRADWSAVLELAPEMLRTQAKDLEVAAYYIEALVRKHGFPGLRDGLKLIRGLAERFWDHLYPTPDEEGVITRVAPLTGLNGDDGPGTLINPIRSIMITGNADPGPFSAWQYDEAQELEGLDPQARERRIANGAATMSDIKQCVGKTPIDFFKRLRADIRDARAAFSAYMQHYDELCGYDAPPTSALRESLTKYMDTFNFVTADLILDEVEEEFDEGEEGGGGGGPGAARGGGSGRLQTREDAFKQLQAVSDFFRRTEPHSPLSYVLSQAIRWGRMSLPELLSELIDDKNARSALFRLAGIQSEESDG